MSVDALDAYDDRDERADSCAPETPSTPAPLGLAPSHPLSRAITDMMDEIAELKAENARLRAALEDRGEPAKRTVRQHSILCPVWRYEACTCYLSRANGGEGV